jgi:predicted O-methyltransferase YrrM
MGNDLAGLAARGSAEQAAWLQQWPGEHYRLLAGLVHVTQPQTVLEIGTFQGLGALALLDQLPPAGHVVTFDIRSWADTPGCILEDSDFSGGRLSQILGDLSDRRVFTDHRDLLHAADIVFMDAAKDGRFEPAFLELALPLWSHSQRLLVLDDVRLLSMLQLWRDLPIPKLDATSLGHWSGTGLAVTD